MQIKSKLINCNLETNGDSKMNNSILNDLLKQYEKIRLNNRRLEKLVQAKN